MRGLPHFVRSTGWRRPISMAEQAHFAVAVPCGVGCVSPRRYRAPIAVSAAIARIGY